MTPEPRQAHATPEPSDVLAGSLDALILGDSHAMAIKAGADAQGLKTDLLSFSGNVWHAGLISFHPAVGLKLKGRVQKDRMDAARLRHAPAPIVRPDLPVIVTAGFHLGRLVPPFATRSHTPDPDDLASRADALFVSRAFLRDYLRHHRGQHIYTLRRIARHAPTLVIAPPPISSDPTRKAFCDTLVALMREGGLAVYDPCDDFAHLGQSLPPAYLDADGVHGNARYGSELVARLLDRGLVRRR